MKLHFSIKFHIDDLNALNYIKSMLNCGNISISEKYAIFFMSQGKMILLTS